MADPSISCTAIWSAGGAGKWEESLLPEKSENSLFIKSAESEKNRENLSKTVLPVKGSGVYRIYKSFKGKLGGGPALYACYPQVQKILQPHSGTIL